MEMKCMKKTRKRTQRERNEDFFDWRKKSGSEQNKKEQQDKALVE